jgi:hypothetical protein
MTVAARIAVVCWLAACAADAGGDDEASLLPADYAATYTEVRDCRRSGDHDFNQVRVLADPAALAPYNTRTAEFPIGSIVVKEEYDAADETCSGEIVNWTLMSRLATASSPSTIDWTWQRVTATKVTRDELGCVSCHQACGVPPDGYAGTCALP